MGNFAEIRSGYLFKTRIEHDPKGNIRVVQPKDVDENGLLHIENLDKVRLNLETNKFFLTPGNVLFLAKGSRFTAAVVGPDIPHAIASVHYFILKINPDDVLPAYLAWYLNSPPAHRFFQIYSAGTLMQIVNKNVLKKLEIPLLPVNTQKIIVQIFRLHLKEKELMEKIINKREKLLNTKLMGILK